MKYLITASLLNAYVYYTTNEYGSKEDFISTLKRERHPQTVEQLKGCQFENVAYAVGNGAYLDPNTEWYAGLAPIVDKIKGGQYQVKLARDITVDGIDFVVYGILDVLKQGTIIDLKTTHKYETHKFYNSPQTSAYFWLVPEATRFRYLIYDFGDHIYEESYYPEDTKPIGLWIAEFIRFIKQSNLYELYEENWRSAYD